MASFTANVARRAYSSLSHAAASSAPSTSAAAIASTSSSTSLLEAANAIPPAPSGPRLKGKARCVIRSHIGSQPLLVPPQAQLEFLDYPPHANPAKPLPKTLYFASSVKVKGPLGEILVPHFQQIFIERAEDAARREGGEGGASGVGASDSAKAAAAEEGYEIWNVSAGVPKPNGHNYLNGRWGLTRQLLFSAIKGVTEGHSMVLRLVGVGYRAAVEDEDRMVESDLERVLKPGARTHFVSKVQEEAYREMLAKEKESKEPRKRLALRLGYSHPILMTVPRGITASTPSPTRIVLKGVDMQQLGQFAAKLRAYRPPEPYKGKGVFVNDEEIKLKSAKKK